MIARTHRFHGRGSLRYVYSHGRTVRGQFCALKFTPNDRRKTYRTAVVISKKINKSAVVRNRIRRRIYEVVRLHMPKEQAVDMIFTVFSDKLADMPAETLQKTILSLLQMSGVGKSTRRLSTPGKTPQNNSPS